MKERVKTYRMLPMSPLNSPTLFSVCTSIVYGFLNPWMWRWSIILFQFWTRFLSSAVPSTFFSFRWIWEHVHIIVKSLSIICHKHQWVYSWVFRDWQKQQLYSQLCWGSNLRFHSLSSTHVKPSHFVTLSLIKQVVAVAKIKEYSCFGTFLSNNNRDKLFHLLGST
jgi:hypothetical protein